MRELPVKRWLCQEALPLWSDAGWDGTSHSFVERLDMFGRPIVEAPRRVMVQARQICGYALAQHQGWIADAARLVGEGAASMVRRYYEADGQPGWVFSLASDGHVVDARRDLYAHAFVILALAKAAEVTCDQKYVYLAEETLSFIDAYMRTPKAGGYAESWPVSTQPRRQNPHMHLLEALLALWKVAPSERLIERASELVELLKTRWMHGPVLVEFFDDSWAVRGPGDLFFEPGHHFEWSWLLEDFGTIVSGELQTVKRLLEMAVAHGIGPDCRIYDEVWANGAVSKASTRVWPYAEAAKAFTSPLSGELNRWKPDDFLHAMEKTFLDPARAGLWIEHLSAQDVPIVSFVPASTLYHIAGAVAKVEQWRARVPAHSRSPE